MEKNPFDLFKDMLNDSMTKTQFVREFKAVIDFVKKAKDALSEKNKEEFSAIVKQIDDTLSASLASFSEQNTSDLETLKEETRTEVKTQIQEMYSDWTKLSTLIQHRMEELKDGEDADEERVAEIVMAKMPAYKEKPEETAVGIRNKLETLTGDERIDISAIKGLTNWLNNWFSKKDLSHLKPGMPTNNGVTVRQLVAGTGITIDNTNPEFPKISAPGGSGSFTELEATGLVNGTNTTFTFTSKPTYVMSDGTRLRENHGWTWTAGTLTATLDVPPQYDCWGESY